MIELQKLGKSFNGKPALQEISLTIQKGEILGLVGPDGAGKTTLIRLMLGLYHAGSGKILFDGQENISAFRPMFSYIPQRFSLYPDLTVMENIDLIGSLYSIPASDIRRQAQEILTFTGLWEFHDRLAGKLSGGMKQKLALASGLVHQPDVFFLDEPTTGVDPVARREFWQLLYQLNRQGMTIVAATPYMDEAELCHRIAFLHQGRLMANETPAKLLEDYPYTVLELEHQQDLPARLQQGKLLSWQSFGNKYHIISDQPEKTRQSLEGLSLQEIPPSLEDVFVLLAQKGGTGHAASN